MDWIGIVQSLGLPVALVVFFVIQGAKREERVNSRMEDLEKYMREKIVELVEDANETLARNTEALTKNTEVMNRLERWFDQNGNPTSHSTSSTSSTSSKRSKP